ncbi:MAG TPA: ABC transporter substrate-binding protein [Acidimicrobiales bacterium]
MARSTFRSRVTVGALALALLAAGCGNSKSSTGSSGNDSNNKGANTANKLAQVDCGTLKYDVNAPTGGTFTDYAWDSDAADNTSFDPGVNQTLNLAQVTTSIFRGLTNFDFSKKCSPVLKGDVAASWKANSDATQYVFKIKPGRVFSNGEPVLPHNFKQAWTRAGSKDLASPYGYLINYVKGGAALLAGTSKTLPGVIADDKNLTLTVKLASPNADFAAIVSHSFFSPISDADMKNPKTAKAGWGFAGATIGNGPYMLSSAPAPDQDITLVPNPKWQGNVYGDTKVHLAKIIFKATTDVPTAYQAFDSGQGDDSIIPPGQYAAAEKKYPNNTVKDPNMGTYYFDIGAVPELSGPKNLELRKAISLAINRVEINNKVYEGSRTISTGITPPGIPGYAPDLCQYCHFDLTAAKQHLAKWEAAGNTISSPIKLEYNPGGAHQTVAEIMQADLKAAGIASKLDPLAQDYFVDVAKPGACNVCRSGWYADYPTYGNFMVDLFSKASIDGNNFGRYDNPEFEKAIAKAQAETDATKRGLDYQAAEKILLNVDVTTIPLNWYNGGNVARANVLNFDQPPLGIYNWERVALAKG